MPKPDAILTPESVKETAPSWLPLVRPAIVALQPFKSARSAAAGGADLVYLDANESPYADDGRTDNRYPDPQPAALLSRLAALYEVTPEQIYLSLGSDAGIDSLVRVFCEGGQSAVMDTPPTFSMYRIWAAIQGAKPLSVPLRKGDLQLDLTAIRAAWTPECRLLFVCTPNNPMGSPLRREDLLRLCADLGGRGLLVVDEAYNEFTTEPSLIKDLPAHDNLVVLRTLSKAHGLAAARCGAVIGHPQLVQFLRKVMPPYPLPTPATDRILESLSPARLKETRERIACTVAERERVAAALAGHPQILKIHESAANFLLLEVRDVDAFLARLRAASIVARDRRSDWPNAVRLTIGTKEDNDRVLEALRETN